MNVVISVVRPFHSTLMANAFRRHVDSVDIFSSAPRRAFGKLDASVRTHIVPAPVEIVDRFVPMPRLALLRGITLWDRMVASAMPNAGLYVGFATQTLSVARASHRHGARFALDRACPYVHFQQDLVREESEKVGVRFDPEPGWFLERQLAEYAEADVILTPSHYTARTFPPGLKEKVVIAPLLGRASAGPGVQLARNSPFTVGVLGGNLLRKGYLYLLEAWKLLALPDARLIIRSSTPFAGFPRLAELVSQMPSVEVIDYIPDIADFYRRCDLFVLPSVDDGFGMALFEAMANGVPSISTRNCGASELLVDGREGLVIDARSVDQLVEAILKLYENEEFRQEIALAGQRAVDRIISSRVYETALTEVLHGAARKPVLAPA